MTDKAQEDYRIQDRPAPSEGGQDPVTARR